MLCLRWSSAVSIETFEVKQRDVKNYWKLFPTPFDEMKVAMPMDMFNYKDSNFLYWKALLSLRESTGNMLFLH